MCRQTAANSVLQRPRRQSDAGRDVQRRQDQPPSIRCPRCRSEPYQPTTAAPANAASRQALGRLGPAAQPQPRRLRQPAGPAHHHAVGAAGAGEQQATAAAAWRPGAPISVIRVRVAGVTGANPASLNRIKAVAEQIERAHRPDRRHRRRILPAAHHRSPLPAEQLRHSPRCCSPRTGSRRASRSRILDAVDRSSVTLFVLILVVCALFVANSAAAAVRGRRAELGRAGQRSAGPGPGCSLPCSARWP